MKKQQIQEKLEKKEALLEQLIVELQKAKQIEQQAFKLQIQISTYKDLLNEEKAQN